MEERTQGSVEHLTTGCQSVSQAHPLSQRRKYCNCLRRVSSATYTTRTLVDPIPKRFTNLVALTSNNNFTACSCRPLLFDSRLKKADISEESKNSKLIQQFRDIQKERETIRDNKRNLKIGALISLLCAVLEQQTARDFLRKRAFSSFP